MKQRDLQNSTPNTNPSESYTKLFRRSKNRESYSPNIIKTDTAYLMKMDMPGFKEQDFEFEVLRGVIHISGETTRSGGYYAFRKSFLLPKDVDENYIFLLYENNLLVINMPKKTHEIPISV